MLDLYLDDTVSLIEDFDAYISERPLIPTPMRTVTRTKVKGRHGSLTVLGDFEDIEIPVEINLLDDSNIKEKTRNLKPVLFNCKKIRFSDDDVYYKVKSVSIGNIENEIEEYGVFTVEFVLDPFSFHEHDSFVISSPSKIFNTGTFYSEPYFKIYGNGNIQFQVNSEVIQLKDVSDYIVIDSEIKECYKDTLLLNHKMVGNFPNFDVGENFINWSGNVAKVELNGRWRYI